MTTKLTVYNNALMLLGNSRLAALDDPVDIRYSLDTVWESGAVEFCLETCKPSFARRIAKLTNPTPVTGHGSFAFKYDVPQHWVSTIGWYSDDTFNHDLSRYIQNGRSILVESNDTVYLRYVTSDVDIADWDNSFAALVSAYMARELAPTFAQSKFSVIDALLKERVQSLLDATEENDKIDLSTQRTGELTPEWINIYNDALILLGLGSHLITDSKTTTPLRAIFDSIVAGGLVQEVLESTGWTWATRTVCIHKNPSVHPAWGYPNAFDMPDDLLRIDGVYSDPECRVGLKLYHQEGAKFYCDIGTIYLSYVSTNVINQPATWSSKFSKLVAASLAYNAMGSVPGIDKNYVMTVYTNRRNEAKSSDAVQSPPRIIGTGSWVGARHR